MIAEHEFVTTFESVEALAAATNILQQMGFKVTTDENRLVAKRGVEKPSKAIRARQLPQAIEMTYGRGRCHLGASITSTDKKPRPLYHDMITTALITIERVLVHGLSDDEALEDWRHVNERAGARTTQHSGCRRIAFWSLVGFLGLLVLLIAIGFVAAMVTN